MAFDKTSGQVFATLAPTGIALTTAYQPITTINGAGFIDSFIMQNTTAAVNTSVRITVDGVVKFEGTSNTNGRLVGVTRRNALKSSGIDTSATIQSPSSNSGAFTGITAAADILGFPYTLNAAAAASISIMTDSLYCNSSLVVEAKVNTAASIAYYVYGGTT